MRCFFTARHVASQVVLGLAALASAGAQQTTSVHSATPVAGAVRRAAPVSIDGRIDETAWQAATPITGFRQSEPTDGQPATLATEVRFLFDDEALYVAARMSEPLGMAGIRAPLARRDQLLAADGNNGSFNSLTTDKIAIALDPYHNHLDEVWLEVNPAGVRGDQFNGDPSWDPVWEAAAHVDSAGWSAEMRIPYSQLRFSRDTAQTWGVQVWRIADRLNEHSMWSYRRRDESGGPAYYGHLEGLVITERPRQVELMPYVVSGGEFRRASPGDPYNNDREMRLEAGADVKYLLTSNLTLDATINPDFGQVEVDPASLNLSAYETFYDEKRPFFVANRSAFSFGGTNCMFCSNFSGLGVFYSRRIGRAPQLNGQVDEQATFVDAPSSARILGAAKITGRTSNGYTVGLLNAVTQRETARYLTAPGEAERSQVVEPLTNYFVGRVKKELRQGATQVGLAATSTLRRLSGDALLEGSLRSQASAVGMDWVHNWDQRTYQWRGSMVVSDVRGSEEALLATQLSPAHWFQRPDREVTSDGLFDTRFDPTRTSLQGYGFYTRVAKQNGTWLWELQQNIRSPGFEVNDVAYLDRTDYRQSVANIARQWLKPTRFYRNVVAIAGTQFQHNWDGLITDVQQQAYFGMEFPNYWNLRSFYIRDNTTDDDRLTRGGPVVKVIGSDFGHFQLSTDPRQPVVLDFTIRGAKGFDGTRNYTINPGAAFKPAANVFVQLGPSFTYDETGQQYFRKVADATATAWGGSRYVFSSLETRIVSFETRVNWTLRPALTLQVYAQPFIASGDYTSFREFAAPRSGTMLDYGEEIGTITQDAATRRYTVDPDAGGPAEAFSFADPNFTSRSLRGTAVLRWEYRPGSTLFFVWTQQREGVASHGDYNFSRDTRALFGDRPENVFLVKATYWIGR